MLFRMSAGMYSRRLMTFFKGGCTTLRILEIGLNRFGAVAAGGTGMSRLGRLVYGWIRLWSAGNESLWLLVSQSGQPWGSCLFWRALRSPGLCSRGQGLHQASTSSMWWDASYTSWLDFQMAPRYTNLTLVNLSWTYCWISKSLNGQVAVTSTMVSQPLIYS